MSVVDRVYARALFEAAQEKGRLEPVRDQLEQVVTAAAEVTEFYGQHGIFRWAPYDAVRDNPRDCLT